MVLENDSTFCEKYKRNGTASGRRQQIRDSSLRLGTYEESQATEADFIVVAGERFMSREYLRRYFDMTFKMAQALDESTDPRAYCSRQFPFEFWLDKEQWPDQVRAGEPQPQPQEQSIMLKITTKTLINGDDIAKKTDDELFDAIAQAEAEIAKCEAISAKPKALQAKIEELRAGIAALVAHMDAKV